MKYEMSEYESKLHRTWIQLLIDHNFRDVAAIAIDTDIVEMEDYSQTVGIMFDVPTSAYTIVKNSDRIRKIMERSMLTVGSGRFLFDEEGKIKFVYRVKLMEVEEGWQNITRNLIANAENPNQANVTEKVFSQRGTQPYVYNEMKFGSQSEIRIAQEFEARKVLFFPLPLAVRAETGSFYEDHREPDFLVCEDGTWGILEVSYHPDRFEKDAEKDIWYKQSGILCVQHYTAERCYTKPAEVVDEFLGILAKHRKR